MSQFVLQETISCPDFFQLILESDFLRLCQSLADTKLKEFEVVFKNKATVCKYAVPNGYPDNPVKNLPINLSKIKFPNNLFYASVDIKNGELVESGSRTVASIGVANSIYLAEQEYKSNNGEYFISTSQSDIVTNLFDGIDDLSAQAYLFKTTNANTLSIIATKKTNSSCTIKITETNKKANVSNNC